MFGILIWFTGFLSMNPDYIELVNETQVLPPTNKKQIYSIYREYIPKNNKWSKYVKSNIKEPDKDLTLQLKNTLMFLLEK